MIKPSLPPTRRAVSTALQARLRGESQVRAYYGDNEQNVVAIVEAEGSPHPDLVTYMTASLHAVENWLDGRDIRVELMIVGPRDVPELGNVVATSAFNVSKDGWLAAPGVVFPHLVVDYLPTASTKHIMWVEPFDYDGLTPLAVEGVAQDLHPLQGVPITDSEWDLLRRQGFFELERALESGGVAHYDLFRPSVV
ncbi:hypothetical protein GCM10009812_00950 [Nocardioides marinus]|uniref:Suppressor of fused-like domain-containing protein n=1 Tax=Nocardioides marinus TaxID=374514 RepID=A0A7Z0C3Q6_9ACTN|nr:suppressor of fused domain protein [Nocardioides marinus]NYI12160.1 hypothetical protein [Nocardioides marinus]